MSLKLSLTKVIAATMLSLSILLMNTSVVGAQIINPAVGENLGGAEASAEAAAEGTIFVRYLLVLWRAIMLVGSLMVILFFLWGGIEWISAGGDAGKVSKARDKMVQAITGLVILVGSFAIITLINALFFGSEFNILLLTVPNVGG